ncbi:MAG: diaminopimelate decarboxylase family protein [Clostridia bacterium]
METLQIGGVSARQLADDFGTPLYVYDEDKIIAQAKDAMENFSSDMFETEVAYASKAFSSIALFKLLAAQGMGFDAVSGGELYGMSRAGVDMSKVYFHGNNKSNKEIEEALELGVGYFVIDNVMECRRLIEIAMEKHIQTKALLRVNPGISAHTHEYIMTASRIQVRDLHRRYGAHRTGDRTSGGKQSCETGRIPQPHRFTDHGCAIF